MGGADTRVLTIWVIYRSPRDFPGKWVLRGQDASGGVVTPHAKCRVGDSLEAVRNCLPPGLICLGRQPGDDPVIFETWI